MSLALLREVQEMRAVAEARIETVCEIEVISGRAGFAALRGDWTDLFERCGAPEHVFQSFDWLDCWAEHFVKSGNGLRVIVGRRQGRIAMLWPLALVKFAPGLTKLCWMGEPVSQYGDALVEPGPLAASLLDAGWRAAKRLGADVAILRKTRRNSNVAALLEAKAHGGERAAAPFAQFRGKADFAAVLAKRSSKAQSSRRRLMRRLQETGAIDFAAGVEFRRRANASAERLCDETRVADAPRALLRADRERGDARLLP